MNNAKIRLRFSGIEGNLQAKADVDVDGGIIAIYLDGDAKGLLSLAKLASQLAKLDQRKLPSLPDHGASEHVHLEPNVDLAASSCSLSVGRLDDKHGGFDETVVKRKKAKVRVIVHHW